MKTIFGCCLLVALVSCSGVKQKKMLTQLTDNGSKYWIYYYESLKKPYGGFCIKRDGTYIRYVITKKKERILDDDFYVQYGVIPKPIWKFLNDSTIMFGERDSSRIIFLGADSIIFKSLKFKDSFLRMVRDSDQLTKPRPVRADELDNGKYL